MKKTTDSLITELTTGLRPVRRPAHPRAAWLVYLLGAAGVAAGVLFLMGRHPDPRWHVLAGAALLGASAAFFAMQSAFPGRALLQPRWISLILIAGLGLVFSGSFSPDDPGHVFRFGAVCFASSILTASIPFAVLLLYQRRGAPMHPQLSGALAGLSAAFLAVGVMEAHCPLRTPSHLMLGHALPVAILVAVGAFAASRLAAKPN